MSFPRFPKTLVPLTICVCVPALECIYKHVMCVLCECVVCVRNKQRGYHMKQPSVCFTSSGRVSGSIEERHSQQQFCAQHNLVLHHRNALHCFMTLQLNTVLDCSY